MCSIFRDLGMLLFIGVENQAGCYESECMVLEGPELGMSGEWWRSIFIWQVHSHC